MTDKSVQKLSKRELLEILVSQGKQIEKLQDELKVVSEQLESKEINIENAGSIAEASLMVNNIFADADAACQQYLDNIMLLEQQQQDALERISEKEAEVDQLLSQTRSRTGQTRRTMPSWTNSRMTQQPDDSQWAPESTQPTRAAQTTRTVQTSRVAQSQQPVRAATATRTTSTRATATPTVTRTTVAAPTTSNRATAARTTATVNRPAVTRATATRPAQTTVSTAAPRTKRRAS